MARTRQTVLVVDDDSATRDGLAVLLESWGYQVALAADGKAALKLCEEELPHAIVTDLMMPGMNGLEFVEAGARPGWMTPDKGAFVSSSKRLARWTW